MLDIINPQAFAQPYLYRHVIYQNDPMSKPVLIFTHPSLREVPVEPTLLDLFEESMHCAGVFDPKYLPDSDKNDNLYLILVLQSWPIVKIAINR